MPSKVVDVAWHEFILRSREYTAFCQRAFGGYLHHAPDDTLDVSANSLLPATLALVDKHEIPIVLFTADEESGWSDGCRYSSSDFHRMRAEYSDPPRRKGRYAAAGGSSGYAGHGAGCGGFGGDGGSSGGGGGGCGGGGGGGCGGGGG